MAKIAIMGFGVVGSGVYDGIKQNKTTIEKRLGQPLEVARILDLMDFPGHEAAGRFTKNFEDILNDADISVVVEAMGGVGVAYDFTSRLLKAGKAVVTPNKALIAAKGGDLLALSQKHNAALLYEASVGGGIPLLRTLTQNMTADNILEINGIINGTTNFILTNMLKNGADYHEVLKEAQALGYAEQDPTADVMGHDTCRKIAILASLAEGKSVSFEDIHTEGVAAVEAEDMEYARAMNASIKLIARASFENGRVFAIVAPMVVDNNEMLANVSGVNNAVLTRGDLLGETMLYGAGAGKLPTGSAVISDVMCAVENSGFCKAMSFAPEKAGMTDHRKIKFCHLVRAKADREEIQGAFGMVNFVEAPAVTGETAFVTGLLSLEELEEKAKNLGIIKSLRVY